MKTFKSFIQLDEVEKLKLRGADELAPDNKVAEVKPFPADLAKLGSVDSTKEGQGKRKADRLDNKKPFGESDAYDKDVKASPKPHDKEAAAQRAKLAALAARKAMMTNKMSEAESHQSKTTMKHISNPNAAEKKAAKDIKPGISGVRDRLAMLDAAKKRGALKNEEVLSHDEEAKPPRGTGERLAAAKRKQAAQNADKNAQKARDKAMDDDLKRGLAAKLRDRAARLGADHDRMNEPRGKPTWTESEKRGALKEDIDAEILFNLYNQLDESNQEIFLTQLEEDAEVLLAFAKTIAEE